MRLSMTGQEYDSRHKEGNFKGKVLIIFIINSNIHQEINIDIDTDER